MAEGDTTGEKDWAVEEPVPMLALSVWEASAQEHACNPSAGLWAASQKEASAPGERRNVGLLTVVWAWGWGGGELACLEHAAMSLFGAALTFSIQ